MKTTEQKIEELEKQLQELKNEISNGKDLNAEKCEIVDYLWRAEEGETYYYIDEDVCKTTDERWIVDNKRFKLGNYFKTCELAEEAAEKVKALLLTLKHS